MINRINLILRAKNITARQFAEEIGIQPSGMSHILGGRNNPSLDFVGKVLRRYPEIDANWLLLGKGEMYATAPSVMSKVSQPAPSLFDDEVSIPISEPVATEASAETPIYQSEDFQEEKLPELSECKASVPFSSLDNGRKLEHILLIYSDKTYVELQPQK